MLWPRLQTDSEIKIPGSNPVILLAEDEKLQSDILIRILSGHGYEMHSATDFTSCIEAMDKLSPELLLSDFYLRDKTGIDLVKEFKKKFPDSPAVILSADNSDEIISMVLDSGADDFIRKPILKNELI